MKIFKNISGETIIEVMLTLTIILLAITSGFKLITMAFTQKSLTHNKVIAINLAREGMESVRYIRDYNWLFYGSKRRVCWNHLEDFNHDGYAFGDEDRDDVLYENEDKCNENGITNIAEHQLGVPDDSETPAGIMEYALKQNGTHWFLTRCKEVSSVPAPNPASGITPCTGGDLIVNGDFDTLLKEHVGVNEAQNVPAVIIDENHAKTVAAFRICKDAKPEDTEEVIQNARYVSCLQDSGLIMTKFYRYIRIQYNDGTSPPTAGDNIMTIVVGVKWLEGNAMHDVELMSKLTDFYERSYLQGPNL